MFFIGFVLGYNNIWGFYWCVSFKMWFMQCKAFIVKVSQSAENQRDIIWPFTTYTTLKYGIVSNGMWSNSLAFANDWARITATVNRTQSCSEGHKYSEGTGTHWCDQWFQNAKMKDTTRRHRISSRYQTAFMFLWMICRRARYLWHTAAQTRSPAAPCSPACRQHSHQQSTRQQHVIHIVSICIVEVKKRQSELLLQHARVHQIYEL